MMVLRKVVQLVLVRSVHLILNLLTVWLKPLDELMQVLTVIELFDWVRVWVSVRLYSRVKGMRVLGGT